jgi:hypothetical protein
MNTEAYMSPAEQQLREVVDRLRAEGWHVETEPDPNKLPGALRGVRVNFLASRDQDLIVGEIASRGGVRQEHIDALAKQVAAVPNARLEVYWTGDTPVTKPDPDQVRRYIVEADAARNAGSLRAALLMALAAFEGAVATFADEVGIRLRAPAKQLLSNLYSLGYVDAADFNRLSRLYTLRSAIAHQATPQIPESIDIVFCLDLTTRMLEGQYISADQMIEWFKRHFEGPEHRVPFESREGGYQYGEDGPYEADDVLREQFPYASEQAIIDAVGWIVNEGHEWVRKAGIEGGSGGEQ